MQVLFFEQVRSTATGGGGGGGAGAGGAGTYNMPSNIRALMGDQLSGDDMSEQTDNNVPSVSAASRDGCYVLHQDFSTLKEELVTLKSRVAEAESRTSFAYDSLKPAAPKSKSTSLFTKPKKFLQKLFNKKVSNASSRDKDSDTQSVRHHTEQSAASMLRRRNSLPF